MPSSRTLARTIWDSLRRETSSCRLTPCRWSRGSRDRAFAALQRCLQIVASIREKAHRSCPCDSFLSLSPSLPLQQHFSHPIEYHILGFDDASRIIITGFCSCALKPDTCAKALGAGVFLHGVADIDALPKLRRVRIRFGEPNLEDMAAASRDEEVLIIYFCVLTKSPKSQKSSTYDSLNAPRKYSKAKVKPTFLTKSCPLPLRVATFRKKKYANMNVFYRTIPFIINNSMNITTAPSSPCHYYYYPHHSLLYIQMRLLIKTIY